MAKKPSRPQDRRNAHARRGHAQEHPHGGVPVRHAARTSRARSAWPTSAATATSTRNSSGAARTSRTGRDLVVQAPPLYIQEKVHPKVLIDDLLRQTQSAKTQDADDRSSTCSPTSTACRRRCDKTEFYQHDQNWSNRMILGDCLQVMAQPGRARGSARQGAVHLLRPAVRHQVQLATSSGPRPAAT